MTTLRTPSAPADLTAAAPPATRNQPPGWRDPRLLAGVVIVAVCVLVGSRVLASADDTVAVWSVRHDVARGAVIDRGDLAVARVHFADGGAEAYLAASGPVPGRTATRDLVAGELLPRSAVATDAGADLVEVPLSVAPDDLPASVRQGATVDVWVTPDVATTTGADRVRARLVLDGVVVVAVPAGDDGLAPSTTQQVIVGVDESRAGDLAEALGQLADGRVVLTRRAGS